MLSELQKFIFLQIKNQNEFLGSKIEFPANNKMLSECVLGSINTNYWQELE